MSGLFKIPPAQEMSKHQGRLNMDADGSRTVVVQCCDNPKNVKSNDPNKPNYVYNCLLYEADGTTQLMQGPGKPYKATGFCSIDFSDSRFGKFVYAWFPEFKAGGGDFDPARMVGRKCVAKVRYNDKREADGFPPELRIVQCTEEFRQQMGQAAPAAPAGVNPAAPF